MITPERYQRLDELFTAARDLDPSERDAFLHRECGDDAPLREEVEAMLVGHAEPIDFLDTPALGAGFQVPGATTCVEPVGSLVGQRISRYEIKRIIATGGMGAVYEAEQEQPHRTVALKVMRYGIASPSALRRFEYEAEILARLQHEGIAQVYEAGTHGGPAEDGGVPFFAMEYIADARPITTYAREENLDTAARLALFLKVCDAVHHGHQKGIVHRDLKPGNILVDAMGQPKIIDFGVARATDSDMAVTTLRTDVGQLIGTLQYMSPEQCAADPLDLDLRSDVYALGVILYELLCDQLPYDVSDAALHEAARVVQEAEPTRPSTINRTLRGDLETITLKALEKERERRYESASELARDIRRYVDHEPIIARRPSAAYRVHKFIRRNRALAAGLAAVFAVLVLWAITASWQASVARTAQREAEAARDAEAEQHAIADEERAKAVQEASLAEAVAEFVHQLLTTGAEIEDMTARQLLNQAVDSVGVALADQPLVEAEVRDMLRYSFQSMGLWEQANAQARLTIELREQALGAGHEDTLAAVNNLAWLLMAQGRHAEVEELLTPALEVGRSTSGTEHDATLHMLGNLGAAIWRQGRLEEAEPILREAVDLQTRAFGREATETAIAMNNLALVLRDLGREQEAVPLFREAIEIHHGIEGPNSQTGVRPMLNLATCHVNLAEYEEAEALLLAAYEHLVPDPEAPVERGREAIQRLVTLYEQWGKPDSAAEYAAMLTEED